MYFSVADVHVNPIIPPLVAFVVSFFTSMGGVSGAFLLLPFQMSVLGFVSPAVSPTNLIFNIVAIPSGVYRYIREGRMAWPLTWVIIIGTLPGVLIGAIFRIKYLPDPRAFKLFVGCVLLYIGGRMLYELVKKKGVGKEKIKAMEERFKQRVSQMRHEQKARVAADYNPGKRPCHTSLTYIAINPAGYGHDVEDQIGGTHGRAHKTEHTHLEGEEQKGTGNASHGGKKGHNKCN